MGDMANNFSRREFACPCCGLDTIDPGLVDKLQNSRDSVGLSYVISSGCRCKKHNADVGGKAGSAHLPQEDGLCKAADIECADSHQMYLMGWDLIRRFKRIEFGKKISNGKVKLWIHVDEARGGFPQEVLILN
jgi:hypothetical protein